MVLVGLVNTTAQTAEDVVEATVSMAEVHVMVQWTEVVSFKHVSPCRIL